MSTRLTPGQILRLLASVIAVLLLLHGVMVIAQYGFGDRGFLKLRALFDVNGEQNIPTLFSTVQLLFASGLLALVFAESRRTRHADRYYWLSLALVFAFLACDEFCELHERLIGPLRRALHVTGALSFAWVIPYAGFVALFAAGYARFWWRLAPRIRRLFFLAGAIYVGGGIGMEMAGAALFTAYGWESVQFDAETMIEEGMEMFGVALLIYAVLSELQSRVQHLSVLLVPSSAAAGIPDELTRGGRLE